MRKTTQAILQPLLGRPVALFRLLLCLAAAMFTLAAPVWGADPLALPESARAALAAGGEVRVLVRLAEPEGFGALLANEKTLRGRAKADGLRRPQADRAERAARAASVDASLEGAVRRRADAVLHRTGGRGVRFGRSFRYQPLMAATVTAEGLAALKADPQVAAIWPDTLARPLDTPSRPLLNTSTTVIDAPAAWTAGFTGQGQYVAILDTGVDATHKFFQGKSVVEACFSSNDPGYPSFTVCPNNLEQQFGPGAAMPDISLNGAEHGTHVAGIAAGNNTTPLQGEPLAGVAPGAGLLAAQIFSRFDDAATCGIMGVPCVLSWSSDQLAALEWVYQNRATYPVAAVNMSLGGGSFSSPCDEDELAPTIGLLRDAGIVVAIATGNDGGCDFISAPGCISAAVAVGASTNEDAEASFSNWANTMVDLFAPGVAIHSSVPGGQFWFMSGTSMATPHVAGAFAVLRQAMPQATVQQLENALKASPVRIAPEGSCSITGTAPRIDVGHAVARLTTVPAAALPAAYLLLLGD